MFGNNNTNDQPQDTNGSIGPSGPPAVGSPAAPPTPDFGGISLPSTQPTTDNPGDNDALQALATTPDDAPVNPALPPKSDDLLDSKDSDLLDIKQKALQHLSPLVGHLEQTPEEKFRTMMMMIQASDDQSLLKSAYEAAEEIKDEKERAQALLDVINEINYFTQQKDN